MCSTIMSALVWLMLFVLGLLGFCAWRIWAQGLTWATARRWLLYVPLALLIIGVFMGFFFYADYKRIPDVLAMKWMNILLTAAFVFGSVIKGFWHCRQMWAFWAELCALVAAHFLISQHLHWEKGGYFWLPVVIGIPEIFVVFFLLGLTLRVRPMRPEKSSSP
jgi:hypothetical protein